MKSLCKLLLEKKKEMEHVKYQKKTTEIFALWMSFCTIGNSRNKGEISILKQKGQMKFLCLIELFNWNLCSLCSLCSICYLLYRSYLIISFTSKRPSTLNNENAFM